MKKIKDLQAKQNNIEEGSTNEVVTIGKGLLYQVQRSYYIDTEVTFEKLLK